MLPMLAQLDPAEVASAVNAVLFWIFAILSGGSALAVVVSKNIVRTAVALLGTLGGVAGIYFLLNAEFLAAVQLVVYAGGTLILIIFGVMLTSKGPFTSFAPKLGEVIVALSIAVVLMVALAMGITKTTFAANALETTAYPVDRLGQVLLGDYLVPFEIVSVLLLAVMIGAAYLAKGRRRDPAEELLRSSPKLSQSARERS
jgi:NADH-quinone oxidoreductase subunit J